MSGGALDYAYMKINDIVEELSRKSKTPLHRTFTRHLLKVSKALQDLEWVLSGDSSEGLEIKAIKAVVTVKEELEFAIEDAKESKEILEEVIGRAMKCQK